RRHRARNHRQLRRLRQEARSHVHAQASGQDREDGADAPEPPPHHGFTARGARDGRRGHGHSGWNLDRAEAGLTPGADWTRRRAPRRVHQSAGTAARFTTIRSRSGSGSDTGWPKIRSTPYRIPIPSAREIAGCKPKAVGRSPTAIATSATTTAYGNCVRTWST